MEVSEAMLATPNFGFLAKQDPKLVQLGAVAERYFQDDPPTSLIKLRQFAALLAKLVAAHHGLYEGERETFEEILLRLSRDRILPPRTAELFHRLRTLGNVAAHETDSTHAEALSALKLARQLGLWFHRTYARQPDFEAGPFTAPAEPIDATASLKADIEALKQKLVDSEDVAARAKRVAEEHAPAHESIEQRLQRVTGERALWQELAQANEAEKNTIGARLAAFEGRRFTVAEFDEILFSLSNPSLDVFSEAGAVFSDRLEAVQKEAKQAPKAALAEYLQIGIEAAARIDLDEAATRFSSPPVGTR